jgi:hypothetical protein
MLTSLSFSLPMMSSVTPSSPLLPNNSIINELLRQLNESPPSPSGANGSSSINLTQDQVSELLRCFRQQQEALASLVHPTSTTPLRTNQLGTSNNLNPSLNSFAGPTKPPEYYNNAKYEDIISKPMKPPYDGSSDQLIRS